MGVTHTTFTQSFFSLHSIGCKTNFSKSRHAPPKQMSDAMIDAHCSLEDGFAEDFEDDEKEVRLLG